jgi:hypothetical protein
VLIVFEMPGVTSATAILEVPVDMSHNSNSQVAKNATANGKMANPENAFPANSKRAEFGYCFMLVKSEIRAHGRPCSASASNLGVARQA